MSVADITVALPCQSLSSTYDSGPWVDGSQARGRRLEQAALELYVERGFEQTTVAEIAERAGLTERTFFRHFADKREVLFAGAGLLQELLVNTVADRARSRRRRSTRSPRRSTPPRRCSVGDRDYVPASARP